MFQRLHIIDSLPSQSITLKVSYYLDVTRSAERLHTDETNEMGSDATVNAEKSACVHCYVEGRVQGVFYRSSTRQQALSLGITGFARNLSDGRVEVYACGDHRALETLRSWLIRGPKHARVTSVQCEAAETEPYLDFTIL